MIKYSLIKRLKPWKYIHCVVSLINQFPLWIVNVSVISSNPASQNHTIGETNLVMEASLGFKGGFHRSRTHTQNV